jgi:predicted NAD/FAD-dependent oxidoreductase
LHRWGAAFPRALLLPPEMAEIESARLSFCGDYISSHRASSVEGAMVTALDAAEAMERRLSRQSRM